VLGVFGVFVQINDIEIFEWQGDQCH
jgi:hypothetical protein